MTYVEGVKIERSHSIVEVRSFSDCEDRNKTIS